MVGIFSSTLHLYACLYTCSSLSICTFTIGTYQIPVELLQEPPTFLQIRDVKQWYVEYLVEMLSTTEGDHEDLTSPLLVVASVKKEDFRMSNKDKYTYQVKIIFPL